MVVSGESFRKREDHVKDWDRKEPVYSRTREKAWILGAQ